MEYRVILFHKQATSARLRFLRFAYGSVCAFEPIPPLAQVYAGRQENPTMHPAQVVQKLEQDLGFEPGGLRAEEGYRFVVEVPNAAIQVILVAIDSIDPPFEVAQELDAEFIDLTQARDLPPVELELLRGAYDLVLGG
jgi:hypothetical protein